MEKKKKERGNNEAKAKAREKNNGKEEKRKGKQEDDQELTGMMMMMIKSLKRGILLGKRNRRGPSTPPPPTWPLDLAHQHHPRPTSSSVSARQLGAALWEFSTMRSSRAGAGGGHRHGGRRGGGGDEEGLRTGNVVEDREESEEEQPQSTSSFHRQIAMSLMQHRRSVNRNVAALEPDSPATCSSSMEVRPFNAADTPSTSSEINAKIGRSKHSLRTSTELLKVLNRIWSLEEQHRSNISLVKALKTELDNARLRIKHLLEEKHMDSKVIDNLMKQVAEDKLVIRSMGQEQMKSAVQSSRNEVEDERKSRKRSETLHRKLAREVSELKSSLNAAHTELERERKARILVENLCDEFAMCIRDHEKNLRSLYHESQKDRICRDNAQDLVLHMSEAWLDERAQMKMSRGEKQSIVEELGSEIETFLRSRTRRELPMKEVKERSSVRRHSMESFPLNEAGSAPKIAYDEDDSGSADSFSNCFELNNKTADATHRSRPSIEEARVQENGKDKVDITKELSKARSMSSLQARFLQHISGTHGNAQVPRRSEVETQSKRFGNRGVHIVDSVLNRSSSSSKGGQKVHPEADRFDGSKRHVTLVAPASPVKKWEPNISMHDTEEATKHQTLKDRLLEARLEGKQSHANAS